MTPKGDIWEGLVRRNTLAQDLGHQQDNLVQNSAVPLSTPTPDQRLQQDLQHLKTKNDKHLAPPSTLGTRTMSKFRFFMLFLLFLLAGFFFFVGGFLTCYTTFPPLPASINGPTSSSLYGPVPQGLSTAPTGNYQNNQTSYAQRQSLLRGGNQANLLEQAENRTKYTASVQARNAAGRVLNRISQGLRSTLGPYLGASLEPVTTGLARSALNQALPLNQNLLKKPATSMQNNTQSENNTQKTSSHSESLSKTPTNSAGYTILVQECSTDEEAQSLLSSLRSHGFGAYIVKEQTEKGRAEFIVKAGQFETYNEARDAAALLGRQFQRPVRVALLRPAL